MQRQLLLIALAASLASAQGPSGTEFCFPGQAGVISCPCNNPPPLGQRGCNNSQGTGGAWLNAQGVASLSQDSVLFTTLYERSTALSILVQGDQIVASGLPYGQGVRCVGGALKRLYVQSASSGSISVPGVGDLPVSQRSAQLGDTIVPGETRYYMVYYRDPTVLGGCPSNLTFNSTQGQRLVWGP